MFSDRDRVLALAGIFQAARLTQQIARRGAADGEAVQTSIASLFKIDSASVEDVFDGVRGLALGLHTLCGQLEGGGRRNPEITRYSIALIQLERKLAASPPLLERIAAGVAATDQRRQHFSLLHSNILAQLAQLYVDTISTLRPRIMVSGESLHLQNPDNVNKIRSLLLAGIRAARLWRQVGGRKLELMFRHRRLTELARQLIESATPAP